MTVLRSRDEELNWLAYSSLQGSLGLFAGTGFSIAATVQNPGQGQALVFMDLLYRLAERLGVPATELESSRYRHKSCPQIASQLLLDYARNLPPPDDASARFREHIAQLCNLVPDASAELWLGPALYDITPAWIITTNYDLILEHLIERSVTVLPDQPLTPNVARVPIYHLHGSRRSPLTIKITEEDYVGLLGPIDYQRLKLPLLMLESTTLMVGYALGDINVRAALSWSSSFRGERGLRLEPWQGRVVQALYVRNPKDEPYVGPNGEVVLEISDLAHFLRAIGERRRSLKQSWDTFEASTKAFLSDQANALTLGQDAIKRAQFLNIIAAGLWWADSSMLVTFIEQALDPIWEQTTHVNQFSYYDDYLALVMDILASVSLASVRPGMLGYLGDALNKVGTYINPAEPLGSAWIASRRWMAEHHRINDELKRELLAYAAAFDRPALYRMLLLPGVFPAPRAA